MSRRRDELPARVACVSFAAPARLPAYARELGLEQVELYSDAERAAYRAFGFGRGSRRRVWLDPRVWGAYAGLLARGRRPRGTRDDTLQLGGDVVVDAAGVVRWVRASAGPEDRPGVDELAAAVRGAGRDR